MTLNIYGIPFVGADICGFNGNTTEELCGRWIQVGAFYPFSRDHNTIGTISQELYVWESVANISRKVLAVRYSLLPYYYYHFYRVHVEGGTVFRPLFFEFPQDTNTYTIDTQFMIGYSLMISPVVEEGAVTVVAYFPKAVWYDYWTLGPVHYEGNVTLSAPIDHVNIHIRGGHIIPTQTPEYSVEDTSNTPFQLLVALNETGQSFGHLYWDDGESLNTTENGLYFHAFFEAVNDAQGGQLKSFISHNQYFNSDNVLSISYVNILGVSQNVNKVIVNGNSVNFELDNSRALLSFDVQLDVTTTLDITWTS